MRRALGLLLLLSGAATGAPLDEALALVFQQSAVIQAAREELREAERQSSYSGRVYLGYALAETYDAAQGLNAGIQITIPLFDRTRELAAAQARAALARAENQLRAAFLGAVADLREQEEKRADALELAAFYRDRLAYFSQAVKEGRVESDSLWSDAAEAKKAEHKAAQAKVKLDAMMEETARRYGGARWQELERLLAEHMKRNRPSAR